jgi:hypothetical protein
MGMVWLTGGCGCCVGGDEVLMVLDVHVMSDLQQV